MAMDHGVFPALLKFWRAQRGLSQFDLSLVAEISTRHISFLETGRSRPSLEMVLLLVETLDVPLRNRNEILRAAGFDPLYGEPTISEAVDDHVDTALQAMMEHHEPYPMIVFDRLYNLFRANRMAERLFGMLLPVSDDPNLLRLIFRQEARAVIENWTSLASNLLRRLQRELLYSSDDEPIVQLLDELLATPDIPADWRRPRLSEFSDPLLPIVLRANETRLSFLMAVTTFDAPQNVTLAGLRIESWFPMDDETATYCQHMLAR